MSPHARKLPSPSRSWSRTPHVGPAFFQRLGAPRNLSVLCWCGVPPTSGLSVLDARVPGMWQGRRELPTGAI